MEELHTRGGMRFFLYMVFTNSIVEIRMLSVDSVIACA
jgi:hypothetical protein